MSIDISKGESSKITVAGVVLTVPAPFVAGHVLRENEAAVLNQTYAENLRNNFASVVKKAHEEAAKNGTVVDTSALQAEFDAYVENYDFGVRRAGAPRASVDPVTREALNIARQLIRDSLKKQGKKVSDVSKEKIEELANAALEKYPSIREKAQKIVAAKSEVGLESLDIQA